MNYALETLEEKLFLLETKTEKIVNDFPEFKSTIEKRIKDLNFAIELIRLNITYNN